MRRRFWCLVSPALLMLLSVIANPQHKSQAFHFFGEKSGLDRLVPMRPRREELVSVRTEDDLVLTGLLVEPARLRPRRIAVIWVHGAGQNFYFPSYVKIARETAARGYAFLTINTRMHDIGSFLGYREEGDIRGGAYWGLPSKQTLDIAAWIQYAGTRGYSRVVLVGHSAGGPAARIYQAEKQDPRVIGLVMASVSVTPAPRSPNPALLAVASQMVVEGRGQDFLPNVPFRLSAGTYLDYEKIAPDLWDFYGVETPNPAITRIHCSLLAWFGSKEPDIGTASDLDRLRKLIARQSHGPVTVNTAIVDNADHLYGGQEHQIARILVNWIAKLPG